MDQLAAGHVALGALIAITIVLVFVVVVGWKLVSWLMRGGFRFQDLEAHQTEKGVTFNSAFKRAGFDGPEPPPWRLANPPQPKRSATATGNGLEAEAEGTFTTMLGIAEEGLRRGDRVAVSERDGHVRLATALETELGTAAHNAAKGDRVEIRIPQGSLLDNAARGGVQLTPWPSKPKPPEVQ
jgi:hypothetical protein